MVFSEGISADQLSHLCILAPPPPQGVYELFVGKQPNGSGWCKWNG